MIQKYKHINLIVPSHLKWNYEIKEMILVLEHINGNGLQNNNNNKLQEKNNIVNEVFTNYVKFIYENVLQKLQIEKNEDDKLVSSEVLEMYKILGKSELTLSEAKQFIELIPYFEELLTSENLNELSEYFPKYQENFEIRKLFEEYQGKKSESSKNS